jgi:hypothetical protein
MPAIDKFASFGGGLDSPFTDGEPITPSDNNELTYVTRSIWVGGAGNVALLTVSGATLTFANFGPGWLHGRIRKVLNTGTTATNMVAVS